MKLSSMFHFIVVGVQRSVMNTLLGTKWNGGTCSCRVFRPSLITKTTGVNLFHMQSFATTLLAINQVTNNWIGSHVGYRTPSVKFQ